MSSFRIIISINCIERKATSTTSIHSSNISREIYVSLNISAQPSPERLRADVLNRCRLFSPSTVHWSPYFEHIKNGWSHRHDENVLFLFYEDLMADLKGSLRQLAHFLGKPLKDEDLPKLLDHLSIKNFKNNPAINGKDLIDVKILAKGAQGFVRLGSVEKNCELTSEMAARIDEWMEEQLKDSDFRFRV